MPTRYRVKNNFCIKIGQRIKKRRKEIWLTQRRLAELANLDSVVITMVELGVREPLISTLLKICEALRISPNKILYGKERIRF